MKRHLLLKKTTLLFFVLSLTLVTRAADITDELRRLVNEWNTFHNTRDINAFKDLYAKQVLFYGKYRKESYCINRKAKFLDGDFAQKIISPIKVQFFSSGTVKCSFTKEVTYKQLVKTHPSYLLFKEENGRYHITGESDVETDGNMNFQLNLGTELPGTTQSSRTGKYILVGVVLIVAAGTFWFYRRKTSMKEKDQELSEYYVTVPESEPAIITKIPVSNTGSEQSGSEGREPISQTSQLELETPLSHKEKGDVFEKYILNLFDLASKRFRLVDWRSDKITEGGHYALSNHLPDIVLDLKNKRGYHRFAIECKWRSGFQNGKIEWAKDYQIRNYWDYQNQNNIPVFIVIGVGGTPNAPEHLYVARLEEVARYTSLFQSTMKQYQKHSKGSFFYDPELRMLS
jgi:hypothetical protein